MRVSAIHQGLALATLMNSTTFKPTVDMTLNGHK